MTIEPDVRVVQRTLNAISDTVIDIARKTILEREAVAGDTAIRLDDLRADIEADQQSVFANLRLVQMVVCGKIMEERSKLNE